MYIQYIKLGNKFMKSCIGEGFVRIFASSSWELMERRWKSPPYSFSLTTWQLISRCLVLSWNSLLWAICLADWLSQKRFATLLTMMQRSLTRYTSHCISQHVVVRAWYFSEEEDLEMLFCFLVFHDIKESLRKMQKPWLNNVWWYKRPNLNHWKL